MRYILSLVIIFILNAAVIGAVWTVDNRPGANFRTLTAAHTAAGAGDTLLIAGSASDYDVVTIAKKLILIGPGYFLDENTGLQANPEPARLPYLHFNSGSEGSVASGLYFIQGLRITAHNVIIERCFITGQTPYGATIRIETAQDSLLFRQNYVISNYGITSFANTGNIFMFNNYFQGSVNLSSVSGGKVINNIFYGNLQIANVEFNNNIQGSGTFSSVGVTPYNNIGHSTQFGSANGNQSSIDMGTVFIGSGTTDGKWQIIASGPADGTGFGGVDCGMFDDNLNQAYILSGIPAIPSIYEFDANADLSEINVKIKANN